MNQCPDVLLVDFLIGRFPGGHTAEYLGMLQEALVPLAPRTMAPYLSPRPPRSRVDRYRLFTHAMWRSIRNRECEVVVFHTPELRDIVVLTALTALTALTRRRTASFVLMMRRGADVLIGRDDLRARVVERAVCFLIAQRSTVLVSDSRAAASVWERVVGRPVPVIPLPVRRALADRRATRSAAAPLRVALLGGFRREKGIQRYAAVLRLARQTDPGCEVICQLTNDPGTPLERNVVAAVCAEFSHASGVNLVFGYLAPSEYDQALLNSDVVVLPYDPALYTSGTSGLLFDAMTAGAVVLATRIAWAIEEFPESTSIVWLEGTEDHALLRGLEEAIGRARARRREGLPADLPSAEAFARGWLAAITIAGMEAT